MGLAASQDHFHLAPDAELIIVPIPLGIAGSRGCPRKGTFQSVLPDDLLGYRLWIASHCHPLVRLVRQKPDAPG